MINRIEVPNILVTICATIIKVVQNTQPLFLGEFNGSSRLTSAIISVGQLDVIAEPVLAFGAKFIHVLQRWIGYAALVAWAIEFCSWFEVGASFKHTLVTCAAHALDESPVARRGTATDGTRAKLSLDSRRLEATLSASGLLVAVVAQFLLVILLHLATLSAWAFKLDFRHLESP